MLFTEEPHIKVGIVTDKKIRFELHGDFKVVGLKDTYNGAFTAEVKDDHIAFSGNTSPNEFTDEVIFNPGDSYSDSFLINDVTIGIDFHWQRNETQQFNYSFPTTQISNNFNIYIS